MRVLQRVCFGAGLFCLLLLGILCWPFALPDTIATTSPFGILELCRCENQRSEDLDAERQCLAVHLKRKSILCAELMAGRRSLWEAAQILRDQGALTPVYLKHLRVVFPGASEDEAVARSLITYTIGTMRDDAMAQAAVLARLEAELARGGPPQPIPQTGTAATSCRRHPPCIPATSAARRPPFAPLPTAPTDTGTFPTAGERPDKTF